jgi:hypothetical protein
LWSASARKIVASPIRLRHFDVMPLFYFNIRDGETLDRDDEGRDLPDVAAARFEARQSARDILVQRLFAGQNTAGFIEIVDETGVILERISIQEMRSSVTN